MNTTFERSENTTDEWYTPLEIIQSLGVFELDPCSPKNRLWNTAKLHYTKEDNGLIQNWENKRVWLNPPYSRPLIEQFITKMAENNNGIALLYNRFDSAMFQDIIFQKAVAMLIMRKRVKFYRPDGSRGKAPGCGSVLVAFGDLNAEILKRSGIEGKYIKLN